MSAHGEKMRPLLLDAFCGAGGAAMGYKRAGFEVWGCDIKPQPRYVGDLFFQMDALEFIALFGGICDAIHASPPCQGYSDANNLHKARNGYRREDYPLLIIPTREALRKTGKPYVIENVKARFLEDPVMLCGAHFGLKVYRHRFFESNMALTQPAHVPHNDKTPSAGNGVSPKGFISVAGTGGVRGFTMKEVIAYWQMAMGIDWLYTREELKEAIPPAYGEYIGRQLIAAPALRQPEARQLALFQEAA
jgi:DNA (cytosine-5)-methyltransferase 1